MTNLNNIEDLRLHEPVRSSTANTLPRISGLELDAQPSIVERGRFRLDVSDSLLEHDLTLTVADEGEKLSHKNCPSLHQPRAVTSAK